MYRHCHKLIAREHSQRIRSGRHFLRKHNPSSRSACARSLSILDGCVSPKDPRRLSSCHSSPIHDFRFQRRNATTQSTTAESVDNHYFDKVLIANRGEIACRIIRTCQRLGIKTVAVHSDVDARANHVQMADEAVCIGPAPSLQSYLNMDAILDAMEQTGAEAVHPGYGFLSENAEFCRKVKEAKKTFLGPSPTAIEAMGDKITSKQIATAASVSTIPGYDGFLTSPDHAVTIANEHVGYPIMMKATAGGGGKGMRICWNDDQVREGFVLSQAEARNFFKDDRVFMEKYVEKPHHIEIQVVAGKNRKRLMHSPKSIPTLNPFPILEEAKPKLRTLCFPERECSIQRRNQKILEESPSVLLKDETRREMVEQVKRLVEHVGYESAGTVEFLVDEEQNFYFLEMNTRLQVEHPVTEAITNVDLVELMIRVASGYGLPPSLLQAASETPHGMVPHQGWAMEARMYAEDPFRGFLPSTGPLLQYQEPPPWLEGKTEGKGCTVRVDSGVGEGSEISMHYDPMISKLITYGSTREETVEGLAQALDRYVIRGVQHNAPFLQDLCRHPSFLQGDTPTNFIEKHYPEGFQGVQWTQGEMERLASALVVLGRIRREKLRQPNLPLSPSTGLGEVESGAASALEVDSDLQKFKAFSSKPSVTTTIVALGGMFGQLGMYQVALDETTGEAMTKSMKRPVHDDEKQEEKQLEDEESTPFIVKLCVEEVRYDPSSTIAELVVDGTRSALQFLGEEDDGSLNLQVHGAEVNVFLMTPDEYELSLHMRQPPPLSSDSQNVLQSPMPGTLVNVAVEDEDVVEVGQELCTVEAMKMQNVLRSPKKGKIGKILAEVGASLKADEVIIEFASDEEEEQEVEKS